ncbi:MAG: phosphoglucomutase/phosphomannomutase family protein [Caldilineales bacterium]|nr:phosphoglucomutase/phosphomannomutase family protein [Caldilineales bacterium]
MTIRFGTDGWRAVISEEFTFTNVAHVAQAIADMAMSDSDGAIPTYVIGYDTRFLSDRYAQTAAGVLAANGVRVLLCERFAATPTVSYAIVDHKADGGIMITASHNPPRYNGMKLKAAYGGSASPESGRRVESILTHNLRTGRAPLSMDLDSARRQGLLDDLDPIPAYFAHIRSLVDIPAIAASGIRLAIDAMYGAGIFHTDRLLREAGVEPVTLHHEMNPGFGGLHPEPIGRHLRALAAAMKEWRLDLGLATDGDADRIGAMGSSGFFVDPHCIMTLVLDYFLRQGRRGAVVKTVSTTQMLNLLAAEHSLQVYETPVGFNYISDLMLTNDVLIGGEESGGISVKGHIPEGDGILMGLLLAELTAKQGGNVEDLIRQIMDRIGYFTYARNDFEVKPFSKPELVKRLADTAPAALAGQSLSGLNTRDGIKYLLADDSWLLIRPSGTEPVLRVYAEARSESGVQSLLAEGAKLAQVAQLELV